MKGICWALWVYYICKWHGYDNIVLHCKIIFSMEPLECFSAGLRPITELGRIFSASCAYLYVKRLGVVFPVRLIQAMFRWTRSYMSSWTGLVCLRRADLPLELSAVIAQKWSCVLATRLEGYANAEGMGYEVTRLFAAILNCDWSASCIRFDSLWLCHCIALTSRCRWYPMFALYSRLVSCSCT